MVYHLTDRPGISQFDELVHRLRPLLLFGQRADRWHVGTQRTEHLTVLLGEICLTGWLQSVGKVGNVRMLFLCEGPIELKD